MVQRMAMFQGSIKYPLFLKKISTVTPILKIPAVHLNRNKEGRVVGNADPLQARTTSSIEEHGAVALLADSVESR
jgi:hypothetical protein